MAKFMFPLLLRERLSAISHPILSSTFKDQRQYVHELTKGTAESTTLEERIDLIEGGVTIQFVQSDDRTAREISRCEG
jgi:hypothetical protein